MKTSVKAWFIFLMVTAYNKEYRVEQHTDIPYNTGIGELPYLCRIFSNKFCRSECWDCSFYEGNPSCIAYNAIYQMRNTH